MKVWKAHGLGNDYLVWEGDENVLSGEIVKKLCHRHTGVGGDGILEPIASARAGYGVRIWNPDGSIAEKSGNGLRIFAWWLHFYQDAPSSFDIDTGFDVVQASIENDLVSIEMGRARFDKEEIPCLDTIWQTPHIFGATRISLYAVGMGNPHCVSFFPKEVNLDSLSWREWGAALEIDPRFPNRSNVQFARVIDPHQIEIRIWERGAGETSASGSSSCAVAAAAFRMGWVESPVMMHMPGGMLEVQIEDDFSVLLKGPVEEVARISLSKRFARHLLATT
ncbi:MAG: diaminopimelate epimerase [Myxococcota bacterium]|nr:diaminopimelate epimerase [Myxococcota bacterium]